VRYLRKRTNYRQWDNFSWGDYIERMKAARTFIVRHLPLSDGTDDDFFEDYLPDPKEWNEPEPEVVPTKQKSNQRVLVKNPTTEAGPSDTIMVFDIETGELVPLEN